MGHVLRQHRTDLHPADLRVSPRPHASFFGSSTHAFPVGFARLPLLLKVRPKIELAQILYFFLLHQKLHILYILSFKKNRH
ncbi:hypothetical protein D7Z54_06160 [Salibacterium salarium]|uniref:Uncharacterized protein n=1 Tax=Salibacterium salarium TaxID=284579 RepID=A0A3R9P716_9BACI|nr:hypothetical protein D7Z54_06160 [Salibacterium salarium]